MWITNFGKQTSTRQDVFFWSSQFLPHKKWNSEVFLTKSGAAFQWKCPGSSLINFVELRARVVSQIKKVFSTIGQASDFSCHLSRETLIFAQQRKTQSPSNETPSRKSTRRKPLKIRFIFESIHNYLLVPTGVSPNIKICPWSFGLFPSRSIRSFPISFSFQPRYRTVISIRLHNFFSHFGYNASLFTRWVKTIREDLKVTRTQFSYSLTKSVTFHTLFSPLKARRLVLALRSISLLNAVAEPTRNRINVLTPNLSRFRTRKTTTLSSVRRPTLGTARRPTLSRLESWRI
jgi:hypothetical protein